MKLYHFTSRHHLPRILEAGFLRPTESNITWHAENVAPDVVWLYDTDDIRPSRMLIGSRRLDDGSTLHDVDKSEVCIEVEVDDAERWEPWAVRHGINRRWRKGLIAAGDGRHGSWWVVERLIFKSEWVSVGATDEAWAALAEVGITWEGVRP